MLMAMTLDDRADWAVLVRTIVLVLSVLFSAVG
jgi:hypothetical protein